jgi:hypothetical protein
LNIVLCHYLPAQLPNGVILRQNDHLLLPVIADHYLYAPLDVDIIPDCSALDEIEEDLYGVKADLRTTFEFIHHLQKTHLPGVYLGIVILLILRPEKDIDSSLDNLIDMGTLAHFLQKLEVEVISLHLRS